MSQHSVSRRDAVTVVASSLAACAAPRAAIGSTGSPAAAVLTVIPQPRGRLLELLRQVGRAQGEQRRASAFQTFAVALREHHSARIASNFLKVTRTAVELPANLYVAPDADLVLAGVIVRELTTTPQNALWLRRFGDLEALVIADLKADAAGEVAGAASV